MNDIMIDLETLSCRHDAHVLSIGACYFDRYTGQIGDTLQINLCPNSQEHRHKDIGTIKWWMLQSREAQDSAFAPPAFETIEEAQESINNFYLTNAGEHNVWGNGATFDITMLETLFDKVPWPFWAVRDVRTVVDLANMLGVSKQQFTFDGTAHNALDDAIYQAKYVSFMINKLTEKKHV